MSALAGLYVRCSGALNRGALAMMSHALQQSGPDDERFAYSTSVGMAYRSFDTDGASRLNTQPLVTADGYMLTFDGRLDNQREIGNAVCSDARQWLGTPDLVLAAYRQWGLAAFGRLIGDFAIALWDPNRASLLLCRDPLGMRPLYYRLTWESLSWSSKCRPLANVMTGSLDVDDEYIADFLADHVSTRGPFKGIGVVPAGHVLSVGEAKVESTRYWSFDTNRRVSYSSDADYESHFTEVFTEAVACRLQADGPVYCELSGGVDSSSIVCVADRLARKVADPRDIRTVSFVFDRSTSSDETPYIRLVEEQVGKQGLHISDDHCPILKPLPPAFRPDLPRCDLCFLTRFDHLAREMGRVGSRVLLSGVGGDQMFWSRSSGPSRKVPVGPSFRDAGRRSPGTRPALVSGSTPVLPSERTCQHGCWGWSMIWASAYRVPRSSTAWYEKPSAFTSWSGVPAKGGSTCGIRISTAVSSSSRWQSRWSNACGRLKHDHWSDVP